MSAAQKFDDPGFSEVMKMLTQGAELDKPKPIPSLWGSEGRANAYSALLAGDVTPQELVANTHADLVKEFGDQNVREKRADNGQLVDLEVREGGKDWTPAGINSAMEQVMRERQKFLTDKLMNEADKTSGVGPALRAGEGLKLSDAGRYNFYRKQFGAGNVAPIFGADGDLSNFIVKQDGQWKLTNPDGFNPADLAGLSGDALEIAPSIAGGIAGGLGGAVVGAAAGSGLRQIASQEAGGSDEMGPGQRLLSGAINVGSTMAGEGLLKGAGAVAGKAVDLVSPARRVAGDIASAGAQDAIGGGGKVAERLAGSRAIEEQITKATGTPFAFDTAEATGSKAELLRRQRLSGTPGVMDQLRNAQSQKIATLGRFADKIVNDMAADPNALGSAEVWTRAVGAIDKTGEAMKQAQRDAARPLYEAAANAAGESRIMPTANYRATLEQLATEERMNPDRSLTNELKSAINQLDEFSSQGGRLKFNDFDNLLSRWGKVSAGKQRLVDKLAPTEQQRIGAMLSRALDADMGDASKGIASAEASQLLTSARETWKLHAQEIERVYNAPARRLLGLADNASEEQMATRLRGLAPRQIANVMDLIEKSDPGAAQQVRARVLMDLLGEAGHGAEKPLGVEMGAGMSPARMRSVAANQENASVMNALYGRNLKAAADLRTFLGAVWRMADTAGLQGSPTFPFALDAFAQSISNAAVPKSGPLGMANAKLGELLKRTIERPGAIAAYSSTPEGAAALAELARAQASPGRKAAGQVAKALTRLAGLGIRDAAIGGNANFLGIAQDEAAAPDLQFLENRPAGQR